MQLIIPKLNSCGYNILSVEISGDCRVEAITGNELIKGCGNRRCSSGGCWWWWWYGCTCTALLDTVSI
jgi:hypothetical protein